MSSDTKRYCNEYRSAGSSIYYLLNNHDYSAWHSLKSDELWHYYKGSPVNIYVLNESGMLIAYILGDPLSTEGANFQVCIKAGDYFAADIVDKNTYSLVGCTVSPGFEYSDFTLADKSILLSNFPQHRDIIEKLCHPLINSCLLDVRSNGHE